jgi:hypothetical protein
MLDFIKQLSCNRPATEAEIRQAEGALSVKFPDDYVDFLKMANGAVGDIGPLEYVSLWDLNELLRRNSSLGVPAKSPGLVLFGSDGSGEAYGFDMRPDKPLVVQIPFIPLDWEDALPKGTTFSAFLKLLYETSE